jgi:hypothetical protein
VLLYIGQSGNLRDRLGSYRFVDAVRHPRRTLRLVRRIHRAEWRLCDSAAEAIAMEKALILEHRPPFNRSGVWQAPPWWVTIEGAAGTLRTGLSREPDDAGPGIGPLPPSFRYLFSSLMRCTFRRLHPDVPLWEFPEGMARPLIPLQQSWQVPGDAALHAAELQRFVRTGAPEFVEGLSAALECSRPDPSCAAFWQEELETVRKFSVFRAPAT